MCVAAEPGGCVLSEADQYNHVSLVPLVLASCDGGDFSESYAACSYVCAAVDDLGQAGNMVKNDSSVYCSTRGRNITVLAHPLQVPTWLEHACHE